MEESLSVAMKERILEPSRAPERPITLLGAKPLNFHAAYTITSRGFVTIRRRASGEYFATFSTTVFRMPTFVLMRSLLDMPGFLGMPAVTMTISEPAVSL